MDTDTDTDMDMLFGLLATANFVTPLPSLFIYHFCFFVFLFQHFLNKGFILGKIDIKIPDFHDFTFKF